MEDKEITSQMNTIKQETAEQFSAYMSALPEKTIIMERSIASWIEYFNNEIKPLSWKVEGDLATLRGTFISVSNKIDECSSIISYLKFAKGRFETDSIIMSKVLSHFYLSKNMSMTKSEKLIKTAMGDVNANTKISNMFLTTFTEVMNKLKSKHDTINTLLQSVMSEMRRLN